MGKFNNGGNRRDYHDNGNRRNPKGIPPERVKQYKGKNVNQLGDVGRMGKYAINLFKDMAKGNAKSLDQYSEFQDYNFLVAAIGAVYEKYVEASLDLNAYKIAYGEGNPNVTIERRMRGFARSVDAWNFIGMTLNQILNSGDTSKVMALINRLPDYRYALH